MELRIHLTRIILASLFSVYREEKLYKGWKNIKTWIDACCINLVKEEIWLSQTTQPNINRTSTTKQSNNTKTSQKVSITRLQANLGL